MKLRGILYAALKMLVSVRNSIQSRFQGSTREDSGWLQSEDQYKRGEQQNFKARGNNLNISSVTVILSGFQQWFQLPGENNSQTKEIVITHHSTKLYLANKKHKQQQHGKDEILTLTHTARTQGRQDVNCNAFQ